MPLPPRERIPHWKTIPLSDDVLKSTILTAVVQVDVIATFRLASPMRAPGNCAESTVADNVIVVAVIPESVTRCWS